MTWLTYVNLAKDRRMSELEEKETPQGGGGSESSPKKRKSRVLPDEVRCTARPLNGRRCEAARMRHSNYCVFHDPEMAVRRLRLKEEIPFEHPDDVQRLLAEAIEGVKKKRLSPRAGNTLGYLATLLAQNQPRVKEEKDRVTDAQFYANLGAVVHDWQVERAAYNRRQREAREAQEAEPERD